VQLTAIVKCGSIGNRGGGLTPADSCALWLQEHRVFEMIFVDAPNDALVPEALVLLQGLLKKGWLRASHLECIWDASVGTHEALSATMHVRRIVIIFSVWREICTLRNENLHTEA